MIFTVAVLLLFLLYDSTLSQDTTTSSQACIDVQMELSDNQECRQAFINSAAGNLSGSALQAYCSPTCRDFSIRIANECVSRVI